MTEILLCSLIVSLVTSGFYISAQENMIFNWLKRGLDEVFLSKDRFGDVVAPKIYYPILYCVKCMPSIYGTLICFLLLPFHVALLYQIPLIIFSSVCLNSIFFQWYE